MAVLADLLRQFEEVMTKTIIYDVNCLNKNNYKVCVSRKSYAAKKARRSTLMNAKCF